MIILALALSCTTARSEIPKRSEKQLTNSASHALVGTVVRTYERTAKRSRNFEYTYGVAEMNVKTVRKGSEVNPNERVFVRYWRKRWIGNGNPEPSHYGHGNIPKAGDVVLVFVKGDRQSGFDVLSPNGFFSVDERTGSKITPTGVEPFVIGKSTLAEILGDENGGARKRFADRGLFFEFARGQLLTGIAVTSADFALENGLAVGKTAQDVRENLGKPTKTRIKTEKLNLNALVYDDYTFLLDHANKVTAIRIGR